MSEYDPAYARAYFLRNKERINKRTRSYYERSPAKRLYTDARKRASSLGVLFDLSPGDIEIPTSCPVFGRPFERGTMYAMSLDRITPDKGYTRGNVQVISRKANMMKNNATEEELKCFAKWVLNAH